MLPKGKHLMLYYVTQRQSLVLKILVSQLAEKYSFERLSAC